MPSVLVAGPPCGGKTTWAKQNAPVGTRILDYDDIVESLGYPRYGAMAEGLRTAAALWERALPDADWVIWTAPKRGQRGRFERQHSCRVVVVMASETECLRRARENRPSTWADAIRCWFAQWEPSRRGLEVIVRTDAQGVPDQPSPLVRGTGPKVPSPWASRRLQHPARA